MKSSKNWASISSWAHWTDQVYPLLLRFVLLTKITRPLGQYFSKIKYYARIPVTRSSAGPYAFAHIWCSFGCLPCTFCRQVRTSGGVNHRSVHLPSIFIRIIPIDWFLSFFPDFPFYFDASLGYTGWFKRKPRNSFRRLCPFRFWELDPEKLHVFYVPLPSL